MVGMVVHGGRGQKGKGSGLEGSGGRGTEGEREGERATPLGARTDGWQAQRGE